MNIQNLPRHDGDNPDAPIIHRIFVPKLDVLLFFDWKNMENVVFAYYLAKALGDTSLRDRIVSGVDLHNATADDVFGDHIGEFKGIPYRQVAKKLNYSVLYGGGARTISDQLGLSEADAKKLLKKLHAKQPGIRKLANALEASYDRKGYIKTLYGRELRVEKAHALTNYLIQGSCAEIMKRSLVKVHRSLAGEPGNPNADGPPRMRAHLVASIHDELVIDAPKEEVRSIVDTVPGLMVDKKVGKIIPLEVDPEWTHTNWAEKRAWDENEFTTYYEEAA